MPEQATFGDFILGLEGLAILRSWMSDPTTVTGLAVMSLSPHRSCWSIWVPGFQGPLAFLISGETSLSFR